MKKILFIIVAFFTINIANAQDKVSPVNELRIDAIRAIGLQTLGLSYERIIKQDMGVGATLDVKLAGDSHPNFVFSPYYRFYFFNNQDFGARGLFVELFSSFVKDKAEKETGRDASGTIILENKKFFDVAMGLSLGKKWVHKRNYIFEINGGIGRFLGFDEDNKEAFFPRFNIAVGYRF